MADRVELRPVPPEAAIAYFRRKGLKPSFDWRDVWQQEHARVFTVAKGMQLDVLQAIRDQVDRAIADGITFDEFRKTLTPQLQEQGWWGRQPMTDPETGIEREVQLGSPRRLQIIFDTNLRTAYSAEKWDTAQRLKERRPYLRYVAVMDSRTRAEHAAWHGTILPVDDPWWDTHFPPNGWNCRCTMMQLADRDLERNGWEVDDKPPPVEYRDWVNKRTGQVERVPQGIDPGFGYNPGAAALDARDATRALSEPSAADVERILTAAPLSALNAQLRRAEIETAHAALRQLVASDEFAAFLAKPSVGLGFPVMRLSEEVRAAIAADDPIVALSPWTAAKQAREQPDLKPADYRQLPELGAAPTLVIKADDRTVVMIRDGDRWYQAAVRRTVSGAATFVRSFRRTSAADVERQLRERGVEVILDRR